MRHAERYGNGGCQSDAKHDRCRRHSDRQFAQSEIGLNLQKTNAVRDFRSTVFWLLGILLPMLDLGYVRDHLDAIEKMARDRGLALDLTSFREIDSKRRELIKVVEGLKAERNRASKAVGILMGGAQAMSDGPAKEQ